MPSINTCLAAAVAFVCAASAPAVVINVPGDQPTIAAAILAAAPNGDEIVVAPGLYLQTGTLDPLGKNIVIRSIGGAAVTTIQGSGAASTRVFNFHTGETPSFVLDGFTITGGTLGAIRIGGTADGFTSAAPPSGNPGASPTIRNCIFENNASASSDGGAITVGVSDSAGFNIGHSTPLIENCVFRNNTGTSATLSSARGGAINVSGGAPTIRNCSFIGNNSNRAGGAIGIAANSLIVPNLTVVIDGCTFSANTCGATSASAGGCPGIHIAGRNVNIMNSVIENHTYTGTANVGALAIVLAGSTVATPPYTLNLTGTTIRNNYRSASTGSANRPLVLVVTPATINLTGGAFENNGFRASDGAELGFNAGISLSPASPEQCTLNITGTTFNGNSTSATTPTGNTPLITGTSAATAGAGGIASATITNAAFTNNEVSAIFFNNGAGSVVFSGGAISGSTGGAGMIVANPIASLSITGTSLSGNSGLINVSGAASGSAAGSFTLQDAAFSANAGGSISAANFTTATITGGSVSGQLTSVTPINLSGSGSHHVRGTTFSGNTWSTGSGPRQIVCTGDGGAGSLEISNCVFTGTTSGQSSAGLISATDLASVNIAGSTFSGNNLTSIGASSLVSIDAVTTVTISNSMFENNTTGAIDLNDAPGTITGSTFRNNDYGVNAGSTSAASLTVVGSAFLGGTNNGGAPAGVSIYDIVSVTIRSCRFGGNEDGGVSLGGTGSHIVTNSLISGSTGDSGAIRIAESASAAISNCTLAGNTTSGGGAGGVTVADAASATIINTISYGNTAPEIDELSTTGTVTVSFSNVQGGFAGPSNIDAAPTYVDPDGPDNLASTADDDYRLASGSAGIDAGSNAGVPGGLAMDLAGAARIVGAAVDVGAFEFQPPACPADFNNSGSVTVQDIFDFLAAYFAGDPSADFNNSGSVTVQDIFDFLAAYFAGCN